MLLFIFLFNVGGYYIVFWGLRHQADKALTARLDANLYSEQELIELKIPITLPYSLQQRGFERINGKFEHNGEFFKLVKRKHERDTLYILCIKDHVKKQLTKTMNEYVKLAQELPSSSKKAVTFLSKLLNDFESIVSEKLIHQAGWSSEIKFTSPQFLLASQTISIPSPPPKG